jgi:hypothetical protein
VAVDEGVLVKTGLEVLVSVRNADRGTDLGQLRDAVEREFLTLDERAKRALGDGENGKRISPPLREFHHE